MFTTEQIDEARKKVKSGADYPHLVQELKQMGITHYDHYVSDGSTVYFGAGNHTVKTIEKQVILEVNSTSSATLLKECLKIHQAGQTDYPTFCREAAQAGVEKWVADLQTMTVNYVDKAGNMLVTEQIPG